jgi:hypothetical protein
MALAEPARAVQAGGLLWWRHLAGGTSRSIVTTLADTDQCKKEKMT